MTRCRVAATIEAARWTSDESKLILANMTISGMDKYWSAGMANPYFSGNFDFCSAADALSYM